MSSFELPDTSNTVVNDADRKLLEQAYYKDGMCFGRDALYKYLQSKYPDKHPSRPVVMKWLKNQKLQQEFQPTRNGGFTDYFRPTEPFHSISIDLIDFNFKPALQYHYILVVIDNFSRKMFCKATTSKEPDKIAPAMKSILEDIKKEPNNNISNKVPKYLICDDGSEFKGSFIKLLEEYNIEKRRTLGGHPESNGLVERANGKIKMLIAKNKKIHGGSWKDQLERSLIAYNNQYNRMTKFTPEEALKLNGKEEQKKLIENVSDRHKLDVDYVVKPAQFKVGSKVRVKLNKGGLGKASTPSWSSTIYTIGKIIKPTLETIADKYKIKELAPDQTYTRLDLQLIEGTPQEIPKRAVQKRKPVETEKLPLSVGGFRIAELEEQNALTRPKRNVMKPKAFSFENDGRSDKKKREFEVEAILEMKKEGRMNKYLVKWKGYPSSQNTWESTLNLKNSMKLVNEFNTSRKKKEKAPAVKLSKVTPKKKPKEITVAENKAKGRKLFA